MDSGPPASLRTLSETTGEAIDRGRFFVDLDRDVLVADGNKFPLTARQADLLTVLLDAAYKGRVATYDHIVARVYGPVDADHPTDPLHVIKVHCCLLRKRLHGSGLRIVTHRTRSFELVPEN